MRRIPGGLAKMWILLLPLLFITMLIVFVILPEKQKRDSSAETVVFVSYETENYSLVTDVYTG